MMQSLSPQLKAVLLVTTSNAAVAFVEDMTHIREVLARRESSRSTIRHLSGILRRLLVEGDISKIAVPRFDGRIKYEMPDRKPYYDVAKRLRCTFFASGGASIFGVSVDALALWHAGPGQDTTSMKSILPNLPDFIAKTISLPLDNFLNQKVLCYRGYWATRRDVIKHIANYGSGVHSATLSKDEDKRLDHMRGSCIYRIRDGKLVVHCMPEMGADSAEIKMAGPVPIDFHASDLDVLLVEIVAAAQLLVNSPDVMKLEQLVWNEIKERQKSGP